MAPRYEITYEREAAKRLARLQPDLRRSLTEALEALGRNPRPRGCRKLAGYEDTWRIRVQDYRVIYVIDDGQAMVVVIRIRHRKEAYQGL